MLAACECSGRVRDAFAARGWDAWSCDILPSETPGQHIEGDVLDVFRSGAEWNLIIAFPPCTDLSLAGARWWRVKQADGSQSRAIDFFLQMANAPAPHVAIENPHGIMSSRYRRPDQVIEPWWFGDPYFKKTCIWLKDLPQLVPDRAVNPAVRVATGGGSWRVDKSAGKAAMSAYEDSEGRKNRAKVRSRTFPGFARACAEQWGAWLEAREKRRGAA